jgi:hypothetical protein
MERKEWGAGSASHGEMSFASGTAKIADVTSCGWEILAGWVLGKKRFTI